MENLTELRDKALSLAVLESKSTDLTKQITEAEKATANLLKKYEKERRDVEKIESESFSSSILRIFGKYEDKLDKEAREELEAKAGFDRAAVHLENLRKEKNELERRISEYQNSKRIYEAELEKRRLQLQSKISTTDGQRYNALLEERQAIISQKTEIIEAFSAAAKAVQTANRACSSLEKADGWATYDLWTKGGLLTDMAKYSHIDDAQACFSTLSSQLQILNSELRDISNLNAPEFNGISSFDRTIDFWFDNIFTNLSVRDQIRDNLSKLERLIANISNIETILQSKLAKLDSELDSNSRQQEDLLVSLN